MNLNAMCFSNAILWKMQVYKTWQSPPLLSVWQVNLFRNGSTVQCILFFQFYKHSFLKHVFKHFQMCIENGPPLSMVGYLALKFKTQSTPIIEYKCEYYPIILQGEQLCMLHQLQVFCTIPRICTSLLCVCSCYFFTILHQILDGKLST